MISLHLGHAVHKTVPYITIIRIQLLQVYVHTCMQYMQCCFIKELGRAYIELSSKLNWECNSEILVLKTTAT